MIPTSELKSIIEKLIPVSIDAGRAILEIYNSEDRGIQSKDDSSPLTKADLASNAIICEALKTLTPNIPIISEENESIPFEERSKWEYCWVVDPLDGTKEFIKRNGEFTTNIGLVYNQKVIAGVVYIPVYDELYYAVKEEGAFKYSNGESLKIEANKFSTLDSGLKVVCSRSHLDEQTKAYISALKDPELVAKGSSLKFLSIAQGDADLYPRMAPTMEWDTCAAHIILEEAGGSVVHTEDQSVPLLYNKENLRNPYFIAKAKEVVH